MEIMLLKLNMRALMHALTFKFFLQQMALSGTGYHAVAMK